MPLGKKGKIIRYALLPGVLPRIGYLFSSGFSHIAGLIALIYSNAGLIPAGHPYLNPQNVGKYGIRHVLAEASLNVTYDKKHLDQIIIFYVIVLGVVLLFIQFVLLVCSLIPLHAVAGVWTNTFINHPSGAPDQDIAFVVLDQVFGVMNFTGTAGFFESCFSSGIPCTDIRGNIIPTPAVFPLPFHIALHEMMLFYTLGIAYLSLIVILYFVVAIIGETITTGQPFGQRFNKSWFIPRLIAFFALIAPMNMGPGGNNVGINAAQYITLGAAKFGSNMASNAWDVFSVTALAAATDTYLGDQRSLINVPNAPEMGTLTQFVFLARMCMLAEKIVHNNANVDMYLVRQDDTTLPATPVIGSEMVGSNNNTLYYMDTNFEDAIIFSHYSKVILRFGEYNPPGAGAVAGVYQPYNPPGENGAELGYVKPTCGELTFDLSAPQPNIGANWWSNRGDPVVTGGGNTPLTINPYSQIPAWSGTHTVGVQQIYYNRIYEMFAFDPFFDEIAACVLKSILPYDHDSACVDMPLSNDPSGIYPESRWADRFVVQDNNTFYNNQNKAVIHGSWYEADPANSWAILPGGPGTGWTGIQPNNFVDELRANYDFGVSPYVLERGWVGAALWYNEIASINGMFAEAVRNLPRPTRYPDILEQVAAQHGTDDSNISWKDRFNPELRTGKFAQLSRPGDQYIAAALYAGYNLWGGGVGSDDMQATVHTRKSQNSFINIVNMILGTDGLFNILENKTTHPLSLLSGLGKSMIDASIRNFFVGAVGQGLAEILQDNFVGSLGGVIGGFAMKMALIGMAIGFVLYYVLPLLPFLYFFFGFGGWVKSIFEAMVAMPLWCLAHIKIDGNGLPGPWASNGYFLLFEIFLRPTLIIFGFLASVSLFSSLVTSLNSIWYLVLFNSTGYDSEGHFFTGVWIDPNLETNSGGAAPPGATQNSLDFLRGPIDELFYTCIYTIIVYMIGISCFKMIDQVPNHILRWMGVTVSTFQDSSNDPAGELSGKVYRAGNVAGAQLQGMVNNLRGITGDRNAVSNAGLVQAASASK